MARIDDNRCPFILETTMSADRDRGTRRQKQKRAKDAKKQAKRAANTPTKPVEAAAPAA